MEYDTIDLLLDLTLSLYKNEWEDYYKAKLKENITTQEVFERFMYRFEKGLLEIKYHSKDDFSMIRVELPFGCRMTVSQVEWYKEPIERDWTLLFRSGNAIDLSNTYDELFENIIIDLDVTKEMVMENMKETIYKLFDSILNLKKLI